MSRPGPLIIVGSSENVALSDQLAAMGAFPVVSASWAEAPAAIAKVQPAAVIAGLAKAEPSAVADVGNACGELATYTPFIAVGPIDAPLCNALPFTTPELALDRLGARLAAALRVRALHGTVLRRLSEASTDVRLQ